VHTEAGVEEVAGSTVSADVTSELFRRTNNVKQITVSVVK